MLAVCDRGPSCRANSNYGVAIATTSAAKRLADIGIDMVIGRVTGVDAISPLEVIGREVIPAVAEC
ncbi:hypothetical protein [Nocardia amamiensis]|uniref:hypothetical protein n=1 Tax=Nocardia amamiensis TaxID=404578 RepID=UPI003405585A